MAGVLVYVLDLDLEQDQVWDLMDAWVVQELLLWAAEGLIDLVLGGPPCATWSAARHLPGGPPPLRERGPLAWGFPYLTGAAAERVKEANVLLVNFLSLAEAVAGAGGLVLLEHPEDRGRAPYASIWATELVLAWEVRLGATRSSLDQCRYGAPSQKPTTFSGTWQGREDMSLRHSKWCPRHETARGKLEDGRFRTSPLQAYPSELNRVLAKSCLASILFLERTGTGPGGWRSDGPRLRR